MKTKLTIAQNLLSIAAPILASSVLAASPSMAGTFASAEAKVFIENFSQTPNDIGTSTQTNTVAVVPTSSDANSGNEQNVLSSSISNAADARAEANAIFFADNPAFAANSILSNAFGEGQNFFGLAQSEASVLGRFFLAPEPDGTESFSFDFTAFFDLETSGVQSKAVADISFLVLGGTDPNHANQTVFDFFSVSGELKTTGEDDIFSVEASDNFTLNTFLPSGEFGLDLEEESASVVAIGSYERVFRRPTYLTLVETKRTEVTVQAPEPTSILGLLAFSGLLSLTCRSKRRTS
jgi:hypothetical protein